jgi:hypothetical protein
VSSTCSQGRPYIYKLELKTDHIYDDENRPYIMTENRPYIMTENRPYMMKKPYIMETNHA